MPPPPLLPTGSAELDPPVGQGRRDRRASVPRGDGAVGTARPDDCEPEARDGGDHRAQLRGGLACREVSGNSPPRAHSAPSRYAGSADAQEQTAAGPPPTSVVDAYARTSRGGTCRAGVVIPNAGNDDLLPGRTPNVKRTARKGGPLDS
jgi:hypothetical protein